MKEQIIKLLTDSVTKVDNGYGGSYSVIMADDEDIKELAEEIQQIIDHGE